MTKLRRSPSNKSWGAGSCDSNASTVVDHSNRHDSDFYTDHASFFKDPSSSSTLHRLLTMITSLFSSDRSETISDISSTEGTPPQKGTRDPSHNRLQRRSTQRQLLAGLDSYAGEAHVTRHLALTIRTELKLIVYCSFKLDRYITIRRIGCGTSGKHL